MILFYICVYSFSNKNNEDKDLVDVNVVDVNVVDKVKDEKQEEVQIPSETKVVSIIRKKIIV